MKNIILSFFAFLLLISNTFAQEINEKQIEEIITSAKNQFAPDGRVAVFNILFEIKNGNQVLLSGETNMADAEKEIISQLEKQNLKIQNEVDLLPDAKLGERIYGIVNLSVANIRTKPNHPSELATQALLGTPVKVLKYDDGFYLVQTPDHYISWVDDDGIFRVTRSELDSWFAKSKIIYLADFGWVYSDADENSQHISDIVLGDVLINKSEKGNWLQVQFPDGRVGYIQKEFAIDFKKWLDITNPSKDKVLSTAFSFMGVPYLWGGTSAKGMDCSGFTKTVYFMNGVILPRDASQQVHAGELINTDSGFDNLQPGDLLFFGRKAKDDRPERVTHVAIYIGNMEYIHSSGMIKINSFDKSKPNFSEYRLNSFLHAKRIISSVGKNGIKSVKEHNFYLGEF